MCDEIAGTMRYAELKHDLAPSMFSSQLSLVSQNQSRLLSLRGKVSMPNSSIASPSTVEGDERLYEDGIGDEDMFEAGEYCNAIRDNLLVLTSTLPDQPRIWSSTPSKHWK